MKQMEEQGGTKKKSRKYSFLEEKLKEEEFIHMISKSANIVMKYIRYHVLTVASLDLFNEEGAEGGQGEAVYRGITLSLKEEQSGQQ